MLYVVVSVMSFEVVCNYWFLKVYLSFLIVNKSFCATLQESISDFYWYYSGKDVIDAQGQHSFSKAIQVAKQVFNTLTEYIQVSHCKVIVDFL